MKKTVCLLFLLISLAPYIKAQAPKLYIHIVSHNEPTDNLNQPLNYQQSKAKMLQMAQLVDSFNVKWNVQSSDGFVLGARNEEVSTGSNIFETLASAPYSDNIEIDPRNKNNTGRNIADQYFLLDSLGANPTTTVGGFLYYICEPSSLEPDWWEYTDTVTGLTYGNKVKFNLLSGAGSAGDVLHCNDLNEFGIFKPDTVDNFYSHNPARNLWCVGTGCAPVLDSLDDAQAIIDMIQGQVDSIQNGLWPQDKFYVTRIMSNQREYGPLFLQKMRIVLDSLTDIPSSQLQWATISETFTAFEAWQLSSGQDYSMWRCGSTMSSVEETENTVDEDFRIFPNPTDGSFSIQFTDDKAQIISVFDAHGKLLFQKNIQYPDSIDLSAHPAGLYLIRTEKGSTKIVHKL